MTDESAAAGRRTSTATTTTTSTTAASTATTTPTSPDGDRAVTVAGVVALLAVAAARAVETARNLPFDPVPLPPGSAGTATLLTAVALALALGTVAVATGHPRVRVGLLFVAAFGLLAAVDPAATLPAVVAVPAGGALALLGVPSTYRAARRTAVAAAAVAAAALSLSSATGLVPGSLRSAGSVLALAAFAAVGVRAERDRLALLLGGMAAGGTVLVGSASPFVVGAVLLTGFGVVGTPYLLVAAAVGGCVAAAVAGLRRGEFALAVGATLLPLAGVPATAPRAMAVLLGTALVMFEATPAGVRPTATHGGGETG